MPRGDKSSYTSKQKRKAEHIEEGYEKKGVSRGSRGTSLAHGEQAGRGRQEEVRRRQQETRVGEKIQQQQENVVRQEVGPEVRQQEAHAGKEIREQPEALCCEKIR